MKHIQKAGSPAEYTQWRLQMRGQLNENYGALQNPERRILHQSLINEQGELCAYTMRRISIDSSHIEHIKPEHICRAEDEVANTKGRDLDYPNMVACFPRVGMNANYRYGAQKKDRWWDNNGLQFISPLDPQCETAFTFNKKGEIAANNTNAAVTIGVLGLDHSSLVDDRKQVIEAFIYNKDKSSGLSKKQAEMALIDITKRQPNGQFYEYCVAIKHVLNEYVSYLTKVVQKRKYAQAQKKKA